jgi:hypothetical protein
LFEPQLADLLHGFHRGFQEFALIEFVRSVVEQGRQSQ